MKPVKPLVGISQCLLGDRVRYDGQSKANPVVLQQLGKLFEFIPVCPEVEAGLGVPRPPVQLTGSIDQPQLIGRDNPKINITSLMQHYCQIKADTLGHLHGFIFKSRSPSCGLNNTPVYLNEKCISETSRGVFAHRLCLTYPTLAVIEDNELEDKHKLNLFIQAVGQIFK